MYSSIVCHSNSIRTNVALEIIWKWKISQSQFSSKLTWNIQNPFEGCPEKLSCLKLFINFMSFIISCEIYIQTIVAMTLPLSGHPDASTYLIDDARKWHTKVFAYVLLHGQFFLEWLKFTGTESAFHLWKYYLSAWWWQLVLCNSYNDAFIFSPIMCRTFRNGSTWSLRREAFSISWEAMDSSRSPTTFSCWPCCRVSIGKLLEQNSFACAPSGIVN